MKILSSVAVILFAFLLFGCEQNSKNFVINVSPQANPWTNLQLNNDPDNFQFAVVADRTGGRRPGVFTDAVSKLNLMQPEFVMSIGDVIQGYTTDQDELNRQWNEFDELANRLEMPFFYVPGNHDISSETMVKKWKQRLGRSYYHFVYKNVLFLCLNTEDPPIDPPLAHKKDKAGISNQQIEYFEKVLKGNADVSWTLLFMHKPVWEEKYIHESDHGNWERMEKLLQDRSYTIFSGHHHLYKHVTRQGQDYYTLATTGGGSNSTGVLHGSFDHITWITMTKEGPRIANLVLDGIVEPKVPGAFNIPSFTDLKRADTANELSFSLEIKNPLTTDLSIQAEWKKDPASAWTVASEPEQLLIHPEGNGILRFKASASREKDLLPLPSCTVKFSAAERTVAKTFRLPIDADTYLLKNRPTLVARQYEAPIIDGKIDDPAWQRPPDLPEFLDIDLTTPASVRTKGWVCYDEDYYYLAVRCYEPFLDMLKTDADRRDGELWEDDSIEIFLDTNRDRQSYYQFIVNSAAVVYDAIGFDPSFDTNVKAAASKDEGSWIIEVAIPWTDITTQSPIKGSKMGFLFSRVRKLKEKKAEQVMQYPSADLGNHRPEYFGNLNLE
jgi:hypothetical protein